MSTFETIYYNTIIATYNNYNNTILYHNIYNQDGPTVLCINAEL